MSNLAVFTLVIGVDGANPNGDPSNENRPRQFENGRGHISQECIKRKLRNAMAERYRTAPVPSFEVLDQAKDRKYDKEVCVADRAKGRNIQDFVDVRLFGTVVAVKDDHQSLRGAVSLTGATTVQELKVEDVPLASSRNVQKDDAKGKGSETLGAVRYLVSDARYVLTGAVSHRVAEVNGVTDADITLLRQTMLEMFDDDASAARPAGTMWIDGLVWHNGHVSMADWKRNVLVDQDGKIDASKMIAEAAPGTVESFSANP